MRQPWNCPYCDHKSMRNWNLSVHIDRVHPGQYNPWHKPKRIAFPDTKGIFVNNRNAPSPYFESSGAFSPPTVLQNLSQQIKGLSYPDLVILLGGVINELNSR